MHTHTIQRWVWSLSTLFLLLLVAMLYLVWNEREVASSATAASREAFEVQVKRDGFDDILLSRAENSWTMSSPCNIAVNEQRLEPLLQVLTPSAHQYNAREVDLDAAGLLEPLATIRINDTEYRLGNTDLQGDRRYVQYDEFVAFVPEWTLSLVNGGVTALANLAVFDRPINTFTIKKPGQDDTKITDPEKIQQWKALSAQQIVTWPLPGESIEVAYDIVLNDSVDLESTLSVFATDAYIAIQRREAACAYILAPESLPR